MGVKKIMEKIHEIGKYVVGGDFFGRFGKIQHTFQGFFPGPPLFEGVNFLRCCRRISCEVICLQKGEKKGKEKEKKKVNFECTKSQNKLFY